MEELDFSKPAREPVRDPCTTRGCAGIFRCAESRKRSAGTRIFSENEKASRFFLQSNKMYYCSRRSDAGRKGKPVRTVTPGEIFGEWAAVSEAPRSATPSGRRAGSSRSTTGAKERAREEARVRHHAVEHDDRPAARHARALTQVPSASSAAREASVFDKGCSPRSSRAGRPGSRATTAASHHDGGQAGALMYVVLEGACDLAARSVVERLGPGGCSVKWR